MSEKDAINQPVQVARAVLPPLGEYMDCVRDIFDARWLTNQGKYVSALEKSLAEYLDVPWLALVANGTLALQLAIRLLGLNGKKVITTPFTYVATLSALLWEGCEAVFADIDPDTLCISPLEAQKALDANPDVAGILPVDVYGNACDFHALDIIAKAHNLRVLYDAAHTFGSRLDGKSLYAFGDAAIGSFHATKLFHTVEGGCIVVDNPQALENVKLLRAFGHIGDTHISLGINAKMTELHAAMGACLLPRVDEMIQLRSQVCAAYDKALAPAFPTLRKPAMAPGLQWNYAYYPVIFPSHESMKRCMAALAKKDIHPRRYFYPSLTKLPYVSSPPCHIAEDIAERVLCLPLWPEMDTSLIQRIAEIIVENV